MVITAGSIGERSHPLSKQCTVLDLETEESQAERGGGGVDGDAECLVPLRIDSSVFGGTGLAGRGSD